MSYSAKRQKSSTTKLPASLQAELGLEVKTNDSRGLTLSNGMKIRPIIRRGVIGRKEARKAERREKKNLKKVVPNSKIGQRSYPKKESRSRDASFDREISSTSLKGKAKAVPPSTVKDEIVVQRERATRNQRKHVDESKVTPLQCLLSKQGQSSSSKVDEETSKKRKRIKISLNAVEQQEEDEIAWLEAHLGLKTAKNSNAKSRDKEEDELEGIDGGDDGLDDLLDDLDRFYPGMYDEGDCEREEGSESDNDLGNEDEQSEMSSSGTSLRDDKSEEESLDEGEDSEDYASGVDLINPPFDWKKKTAFEIVEDTKVDEKLAKAQEGKYIPPALRQRMVESSEIQNKQKLQRQAKGLLNRLGEGNLDAIITEIIDLLYRQYSRADVTDTLTNLIIHIISSSSNVVEAFVILQATLVTSLHRLVGIEFGAHFLQSLVENWLSLYSKVRSSEEEILVEESGREARNLTSLLANLYNVGMIASPLIYDIIRHLLHGGSASSGTGMTEIDVELLHKIIKTCGQQLRHDDATSLKAIVQLASQSSISKTSQIPSSKSRFMLEALETLKNNRSKSNANPTLDQQSITRMKKYLSGLGRKKIVRTHEPLRVCLKDLQDADKRGKWWLVGAAWAGYDSENIKPGANLKQGEEDEQQEKRKALIEIARKHGMNTAIRQDIFVILIGSQDYLDALERLQSLKFKKDIQRREIIRVLIHCIGSEVNYNPYYVILASRLAIDDIGTRYTLQYCLWDFMRELGEKNVGGRSIIHREEGEDDQFGDDQDESISLILTSHRIANVARAYGWWFAKGALNLSATKVFNFTSLRKKATLFLRQMFIHLCLSIHTNSPALTLTLASKRNVESDIYTRGKVKGSENDDVAKRSLEAIITKGTMSNTSHSQGLLFFLETYMRKTECLDIASKLGASQQARENLLQSRTIMKQALKVGASNGSSSNIVD